MAQLKEENQERVSYWYKKSNWQEPFKNCWKPAPKPLTKLTNQLLTYWDSIDDISDDSGWAFLGDVGNLIEEKPEFDPRNWFCKIDSMLKSLTDILGNRRKRFWQERN
jgi:hypothetical protein